VWSAQVGTAFPSSVRRGRGSLLIPATRNPMFFPLYGGIHLWSNTHDRCRLWRGFHHEGGAQAWRLTPSRPPPGVGGAQSRKPKRCRSRFRRGRSSDERRQPGKLPVQGSLPKQSGTCRCARRIFRPLGKVQPGILRMEEVPHST